MTMDSPLRQRCFHHAERAAVARCVGCGRHFCRECVAEHEGRMICGACLRAGSRPRTDPRRWLGAVARGAHTAVAFFLLWLVFYWLGLVLARIPAPVHEGDVWAEPWWEEKSGP